MKNRRDFLKSDGVLGFAGAGTMTLSGQSPELITPSGSAANQRAYWLGVMERLATPVLMSLSKCERKMQMPVAAANPHDRAQFAHLEAFGRLVFGLAPWTGRQLWVGQNLRADHILAEA